MSDSDSGMILVMMMMFSVVACCSLACAVWVMANEDALPDAFDVLKWDGYDDLTEGGGGDDDDGDGDDDDGDGEGGDDDEGEKDGKYKADCVYLYENNEGKKYLKSFCLDKKQPERYWESGQIHGLSSIRVGGNVLVNLATRDRSKGTKKINGDDAAKVINLTDEDFNDKAGGISMAWKKYDSDNKLKSVGEPRDEKTVYFYLDDNGRGFVDSIKSKSGKAVHIKLENNSAIEGKVNKQLEGVSSVRVGKDAKLTITPYGGSAQYEYDSKKGKSVAKPFVVIKGKGTSKVINLHQTKKDKPYNTSQNVGELKVSAGDGVRLTIERD